MSVWRRWFTCKDIISGHDGLPISLPPWQGIRHNESAWVPGKYRRYRRWHGIACICGSFKLHRTGHNKWTMTINGRNPGFLDPSVRKMAWMFIMTFLRVRADAPSGFNKRRGCSAIHTKEVRCFCQIWALQKPYINCHLKNESSAVCFSGWA